MILPFASNRSRKWYWFSYGRPSTRRPWLSASTATRSSSAVVDRIVIFGGPASRANTLAAIRPVASMSCHPAVFRCFPTCQNRAVGAYIPKSDSESPSLIAFMTASAVSRLRCSTDMGSPRLHSS
jgi:hypothetical protein